MLDVGWGNLIDYFGRDPNTNSILIYMESVGDARSFLSAAREVSLTKPVIVLKAGRSEAASKGAASHTGALTGSDDVLEAAFRRIGVLRVNGISDLFYMAEALSKQPRPSGPKLTILSNAGGPAVLATDALIAAGGELAPLPPHSLEALNEFLPEHWSHGNPIDILGDASADRYGRAMHIAMDNPESDGLLIVLAPQGITDPAETAEHVKSEAAGSKKPVLASWMGGPEVAAGEAILNAAGISTFSYPDTAARVFHLMWQYTYNLRGIYETPQLADDPQSTAFSAKTAHALLDTPRRSGRVLLTEYESKKLLAAYDIPVVATEIAGSADEAAAIAAKLGFPVVVKLHSETITHKTDVGGVKLNLTTASAVSRAYREIESAVLSRAGKGHFLGVTVQPMVIVRGYELLVGSTTDPQFGPVIVFGSGGELVEVYRDRALALPPLNTTLAERMMEQTRIYRALRGIRGRKAVDMVALEGLLVRFSRLILENPVIREADINPLVASPEQLVALDARFVLHSKDVADAQLPRPAIRAYPSQYVSAWKLKDGTAVTIRPVRPEDEPAMVKFHANVSERSVYFRYFQAAKLSQRTAHERLTRMCFLDYDRQMALLAEHATPAGPEILGIGRMSRSHLGNTAEVAVLVRDQYHRRGLGIELLRRLVQVARDERLDSVHAYILDENLEMQALMRKVGFRITSQPGDPSVLFAHLSFSNRT